jgi:hypothetical protein
MFLIFRRVEDGALMYITELALIFVYVAVLLIKSCDFSSLGAAYRDNEQGIKAANCRTYGFGDTANGKLKQRHSERDNCHSCCRTAQVYLSSSFSSDSRSYFCSSSLVSRDFASNCTFLK